jgi:hypothetical protein
MREYARVLRSPFAFDLTLPGGNAVPRRMVLTANQLVVTYAPWRAQFPAESVLRAGADVPREVGCLSISSCG